MMNAAKTLAAIVALWICLPAARLPADIPMQILSETYHVSGVAYVDYTDVLDQFPPEGPPSEYLNYDRTRAHPPASAGVTTTLKVDLGGGSFPLYASSTATRYPGAEGLAFHVEANSGPYKAPQLVHPGILCGAGADASLSVDFRLPGSDQTVRLATDCRTANYYTPSLATLTDLDTGVSEILFRSGYFGPPDIGPVEAMDIRGTHTYRLAMSVHNGCLDFTALTLEMVDVSPVPVPGAVLLGALGLAWAGRWLRRQAV